MSNRLLEVKYQSKITPVNYRTLKRMFHRGIVLTKDIFFSIGNIVGIPVSIFLSVLGSEWERTFGLGL